MDTDEKSTEMLAFRGTRDHYSKMTKIQLLGLQVKFAYSDDLLPVISQWEIHGNRMANSADADQTARDNANPDQEQSDLGLHCLPRPVCLKT